MSGAADFLLLLAGDVGLRFQEIALQFGQLFIGFGDFGLGLVDFRLVAADFSGCFARFAIPLTPLGIAFTSLGFELLGCFLHLLFGHQSLLFALLVFQFGLLELQVRLDSLLAQAPLAIEVELGLQHFRFDGFQAFAFRLQFILPGRHIGIGGGNCLTPCGFQRRHHLLGRFNHRLLLNQVILVRLQPRVGKVELPLLVLQLLFDATEVIRVLVDDAVDELPFGDGGVFGDAGADLRDHAFHLRLDHLRPIERIELRDTAATRERLLPRREQGHRQRKEHRRAEPKGDLAHDAAGADQPQGGKVFFAVGGAAEGDPFAFG